MIIFIKLVAFQVLFCLKLLRSADYGRLTLRATRKDADLWRAELEETLPKTSQGRTK